MSVTFEPAVEVRQYQISCACGDAAGKQVFPSFEVAYKALKPGNPIPFEKPACADEWCAMRGLRVRSVGEDELHLNLGNPSAYSVLSLLGLPTDSQEGSMEGRYLLNLVKWNLAKFPAVEGERSPVIAGRHEGWLQEALTQLEVIASYASERDAEVVWG
jgi:hypothetical protein